MKVFLLLQLHSCGLGSSILFWPQNIWAFQLQLPNFLLQLKSIWSGERKKLITINLLLLVSKLFRWLFSEDKHWRTNHRSQIRVPVSPILKKNPFHLALDQRKLSNSLAVWHRQQRLKNGMITTLPWGEEQETLTRNASAEQITYSSKRFEGFLSKTIKSTLLFSLEVLAFVVSVNYKC